MSVDFLQPKLLTDKSRLQEIYDLRVKAWEPFDIITPINYPGGFCDELDPIGLHWIIEKNAKIVAAARLNIVHNPKELPYPKTFMRVIDFKFDTFFYYSRLVVDPEVRGMGLAQLLDGVRIKYIRNHDNFVALATASLWRVKKLETYGFKIVGKVQKDDDYQKMDNLDSFIIKIEGSNFAIDKL